MYTYELDDPAIAVQEIMTQLEKIRLLKNTIGILMCDPEFIDSGVYPAVCQALPFAVAGATTMSQGVNGVADILMLTLMVLTSDDVFFEAGFTEPIPNGGDALAPTKTVYEAVAAQLPEKPKLVLVFPPLLLQNSGDRYIEAFEGLCPDTPVFGTLAISDSIDFKNCCTLWNGESSLSRMAFILVAGNVSPHFFIATVSNTNTLPYSGEITKSEGNIVQEINDVRTSEYFESIGFAKHGVLDEGIQFVPLRLDLKKRTDYDGVPVMRAMVTFDENGYGVGRGNMYQNSVFTLINPTGDDTMKTSTELVDKLAAVTNPQAAIIFSCLVRRMTLGDKPLTEANMIVEKLSGLVPFMFAYAGGEICPTSHSPTKVTNRFHNYSIIACVL
jgi:hypothetical protein